MRKFALPLRKITRNRRYLDHASATLDALCLFGVPTFAIALIAWAGDAVIALLPLGPHGERDSYFALEAIGSMGAVGLVTLIIANRLYNVLHAASLGLQQRIAALETDKEVEGAHSPSPMLHSTRIRVGRLVRQKGLSSIRDVERKYRPLE
jgi:hypothetical protein